MQKWLFRYKTTVQRWLNDRFVVYIVASFGPRKHKFNRIRQVAPLCPHGKTHCRHLANTIELSICGANVPYVKLL